MERCCVSSAFCICGSAKRGWWQRLGVACCSNCLRVSTIRGSVKRSPGSLRSRTRRLLLLVSWHGEVRPETATESGFYRRMLTRSCSLSGWQSILPRNDVRAAFPNRKARVNVPILPDPGHSPVRSTLYRLFWDSCFSHEAWRIIAVDANPGEAGGRDQAWSDRLDERGGRRPGGAHRRNDQRRMRHAIECIVLKAPPSGCFRCWRGWHRHHSAHRAVRREDRAARVRAARRAQASDCRSVTSASGSTWCA